MDPCPVPYDNLDPGIREAVRALNDHGFRTRDSGDGKHKATLGWDPESYSDVAHVVIETTFEAMGADLRRLAGWALPRFGTDLEIQAVVFVAEGEPDVAILLGGDALFGWAPGATSGPSAP